MSLLLLSCHNDRVNDIRGHITYRAGIIGDLTTPSWLTLRIKGRIHTVIFSSDLMGKSYFYSLVEMSA